MTLRYDINKAATGYDGSGISPGHVTNYAQNENSEVWSMDQLRAYMGEGAFNQLWSSMEKSSALAVVSALPRVQVSLFSSYDTYAKVSYTDKWTKSKHTDKWTGSQHTDKRTESQHTDKRTESQHTDKRTESQHTDKRTESQHTDKRTESRHTDKQTESQHTDKQTESQHTDEQTESQHTDKRTGSQHSSALSTVSALPRVKVVFSSNDVSQHTDKWTESQHTDKQTGSQHTDKWTESQHTDERTGSQHTDKQTESQHTDKRTGSQLSYALAAVSCLPRVKELQKEMSLPPRSCFQFLGLDFVVDSKFQPWLLEVNATPSMKVEHEDPGLERLIHDQKWPVIRDMVQLLGICPDRFDEDVDEHQSLGVVEAEMKARGGFSPLMHLFPAETPQGFRLIPWHPLDVSLRLWTRSQKYLQALKQPA
eukprot:gene12493-15705_t